VTKDVGKQKVEKTEAQKRHDAVLQAEKDALKEATKA